MGLFLKSTFLCFCIFCFALTYKIFGQSRESSFDLLLKSKEYQTIKPDSALYFAEMAIDGEIENDSLRAAVYAQYTLSLVENRLFDETENVIIQALELSRKLSDSSMLSRNFNTYGNFYFYSGKNDKALDKYRKSLELDRKYGSKSDFAKSLTNFAILLNRMGRETEAKNSYLTALTIFREQKDKNSELRTLVNLSSIFGNIDEPFFDLDSAIFFGKQAKALAEELNFDFGIAKANGVLCSPLIRKGYSDPSYLEEGLISAIQARIFFQDTRFTLDYQFAKINEGYAYEALGRTKEAIKIARELIEEGFSEQHECYRLLYRSYKKQNEFRNALINHEIYLTKLDSLQKQKLKQELNEIQTKYESVQKDNEIAQLSQEASIRELEIQQKNLYNVVLIISIVVILLTVILIYRQNQLRNAQRISNLQQRFLRSQMNPHFIFNALSSIQSFILNNEPKNAVGYLAKFSKLMRQILEHSRMDYIFLEEEISMITNYLEVQKMRFESRFDYEITIDPSLNPEEIKIPPMFAQPFIENSIEHGLKDKKLGGLIKLSFLEENKVIRIKIEDNGSGISHIQDSNEKKHRSLSTLITRERLSILEKGIGRQLGFDIKNASDDIGNTRGTLVDLIIPFIRT